MESHDVPIRVDHVGIAVHEVAAAEPVLRALGCEKVVEESVEGRFTWAYYRLGGASRIELIEPVAEDTFLTDYLAEHGPGLHHVTLEVGDVDAVIDHLEDAGLDVVDRAEFDDWTEAFVSPRNPTGTLFQLMEYHDGFHESRPENLYVGGHRVGERP
jgi:methylmalonyl-CoA/ethylmalonyl-CoA epimerase